MILTAVDDSFLPEAASLIKSCARYAPKQHFYLFLVNSSEQRIAELRHCHQNLIVEHVWWPYDAERWRGLMCSARSIPILKVLRSYKQPTLYLDSDMLVMAPLDELFAELETFDLLVKYRPQCDVLGAGGTKDAAKFNSGVIAIGSGRIALQFAEEYNRHIREWIDQARPLCRYDEESRVSTCIDQEFLYLVYEQFKDRLKFKPLPDEFNDTRFRLGSVIWHGKGMARKYLPYHLAKLSYDNRFIHYVFSLIRYPLCFGYYHLSGLVRTWKNRRHIHEV